MNVTSQLAALKSLSKNLTLAERAEVSSQLAKQLEKAGKYEAACEALEEFWPQRNAPPKLRGLDDLMKAKVLLRVGALAGWLGSADQTEGSQEAAKNLITQSIGIFDKLGHSEKAAEARGDLALCYWREGGFDEARIYLANALSHLRHEQSEQKAVLLIRAGIIEERTRRLQDALRFYNEAAPLVEQSEDHALKGSFHFEYGLLLRRLAAPENREDYLDQALIEYATSSFHYEQAGNVREVARVENNLGFLFFTIRQYKDAHKHLDRARHWFLALKDIGSAAQVDETRARTLLAEGRLREAERLIRSAVRTLEKGGQQAVLAEALTTYGTVLARLGNGRAKALLGRAVEVAETAGDLEGAGRAKLSIIEELGEKLPVTEMISIHRSAIHILKDSQDPSTARRLISCGEKLLDIVENLERAGRVPSEKGWEGFSFRQYVRSSERTVIERALRDAGGQVTKAARLLGFKHHQSLLSLMKNRHQELLRARHAVRKRRRSMSGKKSPVKRPSGISILHVTDNEKIAGVLAKMFGAEEWRVDVCKDRPSAMKKLTGKKRYDLLLFDNDMAEVSGLELVSRARNLRHRRRTPIIMFTAAGREREGWRARVDDVLGKPDEVHKVPATIARLLRIKLKGK